ncbi:hypothetical protein Poly51_29060 [Rubripirellula tenax]|uniref:Uncharacterized protein n=1 Tax=Rubripirellula tenax TaxID=2528015 RepID=A0A5C6F9Y3_9BACT|nr:hypothetical protein [Rubripirellula tenax]TWU56986.1 hypothetical protein Poly51_29060 [Rubripirellula tenax]
MNADDDHRTPLKDRLSLGAICLLIVGLPISVLILMNLLGVFVGRVIVIVQHYFAA